MGLLGVAELCIDDSGWGQPLVQCVKRCPPDVGTLVLEQLDLELFRNLVVELARGLVAVAPFPDLVRVGRRTDHVLSRRGRAALSFLQSFGDTRIEDDGDPRDPTLGDFSGDVQMDLAVTVDTDMLPGDEVGFA